MRRPTPSRRAAPYIGGILLVALVVGLAVGGGSEGTTGGGSSVTDRQLAELRTGPARDDVERLVGPGEDALEFNDTAGAVEPIDAECRYYHTGLGFGVVQLCYHDDRLVSKRRYEPPPGAGLGE